MAATNTKRHQAPLVVFDELDQLGDVEDKMTIETALTSTGA